MYLDEQIGTMEISGWGKCECCGKGTSFYDSEFERRVCSIECWNYIINCVQNKHKTIYDRDYEFDERVEIIFNQIANDWSLNRLLLNYVEVNEFKLSIEKGLFIIENKK